MDTWPRAAVYKGANREKEPTSAAALSVHLCVFFVYLRFPLHLPKCRNLKEFVTTLTEDRAMATAATSGLRRPAPAMGMATTL